MRRSRASLAESLYRAVLAGDIDTVDRLLREPDVDINVTWYGNNLLFEAILHNRPEVAEYLVRHGIDYNFRALVYARDERQQRRKRASSRDGVGRVEDSAGARPDVGLSPSADSPVSKALPARERVTRTNALVVSCRALAIERGLWDVVLAIDQRVKYDSLRRSSCVGLPAGGRRRGSLAGGARRLARADGRDRTEGDDADDVGGDSPPPDSDADYLLEGDTEDRTTGGSDSSTSKSSLSYQPSSASDSTSDLAVVAFLPATAPLPGYAGARRGEPKFFPDLNFRFLTTRCSQPTAQWSSGSLYRWTPSYVSRGRAQRERATRELERSRRTLDELLWRLSQAAGADGLSRLPPSLNLRAGAAAYHHVTSKALVSRKAHPTVQATKS